MIGPGDPQHAEARSLWPQAHDLGTRLAERGGGTVHAILLYGSHLLKTSPDKHSAVDLVVIVDDYERFYSALRASGELHRSVLLMTALSRLLAPNTLAFAPDEGREGIAKFLLISKDDFERALGPNPPDHFILGRMVQQVGVVWTSGADASAWLEARLDGARNRVLDWMKPYVDGPVDTDGLGRRILEVCYASEFRPESSARAGRIFEAQSEHFRSVLAPVLERAVDDGRMVRDGDRYAFAEPATRQERRRWRWHFAKSKARTTSRWFKHIVTFANWLPYIVRKVERHSGRTIHLTTLERKLPIIFLWPRVFHVLLTRPRKEIRR